MHEGPATFGLWVKVGFLLVLLGYHFLPLVTKHAQISILWGERTSPSLSLCLHLCQLLPYLPYDFLPERESGLFSWFPLIHLFLPVYHLPLSPTSLCSPWTPTTPHFATPCIDYLSPPPLFPLFSQVPSPGSLPHDRVFSASLSSLLIPPHLRGLCDSLGTYVDVPMPYSKPRYSQCLGRTVCFHKAWRTFVTFLVLPVVTLWWENVEFLASSTRVSQSWLGGCFEPCHPLWWDCPEHCRVLNSILGLYPLVSDSTFPDGTVKTVSRRCQCPLAGWNHYQLRTTDLRQV